MRTGRPKATLTLTPDERREVEVLSGQLKTDI